MDGNKIFARTVTHTQLEDKYGNKWQYHSRSDAHSKAACWGIMFDLLQHCSLIAQHTADSKVGFGINHEMHDYRQNRKKNLDLVVCTPAEGHFSSNSFANLADQYAISLLNTERKILAKLPILYQCPVGATLVALEAKACMTEHLKARPRLYDELASSFQTIHGDTNSAIAAALVAINIATTFISPGRNKINLSSARPEITRHRQPEASIQVLNKVRELSRRSSPDDIGYDAIGVVLLDCANDGSEVILCGEFQDGSKVDKILSYENMIERIAHIYAARFSSI